MNRLTIPGLLVAVLFALPAAASPTKTDVKRAFKSRDKDRVVSVLESLRDHLDKKTVKAILDNANRLRSIGVYDDIVATLATAKDDALKELVKAYKKQKKGHLRFLVLDALGRAKHKSAEDTVIGALKKDKDEPIRVLAARLLGKRGTRTAVEALIPILAGFEKDSKKSHRLIREVNAALANLTGQADLNVALDWKNWWSSHKDEFKPAGDDDGSKTKSRGLLERMKRERPADLKTIQRVKKNEIVVIRGRSDKVEDVLDELELKYKKIKREEFTGLQLDPNGMVLILNCPGRDQFPEGDIQRIRQFVAKGGYLFCSDWELKKTLAPAFPEAVEFFKETPKGGNKKVTILPTAVGKRHPLMRDVFPLNTFDGRGFAWVMEQRSHLAKENRVIVPLVSCPDIKNLGTTTVAFTFTFTAEGKGPARPVTGGGKKVEEIRKRAGRVLWVSSHFKLQKDEKGDGFALQQLLLNFILEKQEQRKQQRRR